MKQILLADDDFLALNAFYSLTDWAQLGLRIAYEAHSGREALSYLADCHALPDVAFIDVCMPDMDGIALLQALRAQYPSIVCFMLSSHSDYPYVRETLKLGAADYLLKHEINPESIIAALTQHGLAQLQCSEIDTPDRQLLRVLSGDRCTPLSGYLLCANDEDERPLLEAQQSSILQTCRHILNDVPGAAVCAPSESTLALMLPVAADRKGNRAQQTATLLHKALVKYHNVHYAFSAPRLCGSSEELQAAYRLLVRHREPRRQPQLSARETAVLALAITNGSKPLLAQTLQTLFEASTSIQELCGELMRFLLQTRRTMSLPPEPGMDVPAELAQGQQYFFDQLSLLCDRSSACQHMHFSPTIREALDYIGAHYAEDMQLRDVAQHCHLSYAHLSYVFKKETGASMIRYLTRLRVYHAAYALLFGHTSVSAACQIAGFGGYNHFVSTFKAVTGMTPSEFRKNPAAVNWLLRFNVIENSPDVLEDEEEEPI